MTSASTAARVTCDRRSRLTRSERRDTSCNEQAVSATVSLRSGVGSQPEDLSTTLTLLITLPTWDYADTACLITLRSVVRFHLALGGESCGGR
jgi:hypothetical protein